MGALHHHADPQGSQALQRHRRLTVANTSVVPKALLTAGPAEDDRVIVGLSCWWLGVCSVGVLLFVVCDVRVRMS